MALLSDFITTSEKNPIVMRDPNGFHFGELYSQESTVNEAFLI